MASRPIAWAFALVASLAALPRPVWPDQAVSATGTAAGSVIQQYCTGCHNAKLKTGGLVLDVTDLGHIGDRSAIWERVVRKLRTGEMPPAGMPRGGHRLFAL